MERALIKIASVLVLIGSLPRVYYVVAALL